MDRLGKAELPRRIISPLAQSTALIFAGGFVLLGTAALLRTPDMSPRWMLIAFAAGALLQCVYAVVRGDRLTLAEVTPMVVGTMAVTVLLSWNTNLDLAALANGATLPIMAFYVVWFLPAARGRVILYGGCVCWWIAIVLRGDPFLSAIAVMVLTQVAIGAEVLARVRATDLRLAHVDLLTGAVDRTGFTEACELSLVKLHDRGTPFSIISMDLDGLREINNRHGHRAGDAMLVEACRHWSAQLRDRDLLGRIGGDEFVIVLPGSGAIEARDIERRIRVGATVAWSAGVAQARPDDTLETLMHRADERMYRQKAARHLLSEPFSLLAPAASEPIRPDGREPTARRRGVGRRPPAPRATASSWRRRASQ